MSETERGVEVVEESLKTMSTQYMTTMRNSC